MPKAPLRILADAGSKARALPGSVLRAGGLVSLASRRMPLIVGCIGLWLAVALIYLVASPATYTATASILVDPHRAASGGGRPAVSVRAATALVESEAQILRSEDLALTVVRELALVEDRDPLLVRHAAREFMRNVKVQRVATTYVIELAVTARTPGSAAALANGLARAYLAQNDMAEPPRRGEPPRRRIVDPAHEPLEEDSISAAAALGGAMMLGGTCGIGAAWLRERMADVWYRAGDLADELGVPCFGVLPEVAGGGAQAPGAQARLGHILAPAGGPLREVMDAPFSRFTDVLRNAKVSLWEGAVTRGHTVLGVTSALQGEGKTTVAVNLAQLVAQAGRRTILLDFDLRRTDLTQNFVAPARLGLVEVLSGRVPLVDALWTDPRTGLVVLPSVLRRQSTLTADLLASDMVRDLVNRLREDYEFVIIDLPPILPVADVKAASRLVDGFMLVVEWARTGRPAVGEALGVAAGVRERLMGCVLSKADPVKLKRFEAGEGCQRRYYRSAA